MKKHVKRALSVLLVLSMLLTIMSTQALAADTIMPYEKNDDWEKGENIESISQSDLPVVDEPPDDKLATDELDTDEIPIEEGSEDEPLVEEEAPGEDEGIPEDESISFYASNYNFGDYTYSLYNEQATITAYSGTDSFISIPGSMDGYPVVAIGSAAFRNKTTITGITLPDSLTTIGSNAFYGCTALTEITIPAGITSISSNAFYNSVQKLTFSPGTTAIPANACYNATKLKEVVIPDTVTSIGGSAFRGCTSLTSVSLPSGLTTISSRIFYGCTALSSIAIPDAVTSIDSDAFHGCTSLNNVTLPGSLTKISSNVFYGCTALTEITIPAGITSISSSAFYNSVQKVIFSPGTTAIPASACYNATKLQEVVIPSTVTSIGSSAFRGCTNLASVSLPGSLAKINSSTFYGCTALSGIAIPETVTSIGSDAFHGCTSLNNVTLPGSLTTIGSSAFYGCTSLTEITIPAGITSISSSVFYNSVQKLTFAPGTTAIPANACYNATKLKEIVIPSTVTSIGGSAFRGCTSLASVSLPGSLAKINSSTFYGCTALSGIAIPETVTSIGSDAFHGCTSLNNVTLPGSLTTIGSSAFYGCTSLTEITVPAGITSISSSAFYNSVQKLTFASGTTAIPANACNNATKLKEVVIPDTVTSIGSSAFRSCTSLTSFSLPSSITAVDAYTFYGCKALENISLGNLSTIGNSMFYGCTSLTQFTVPASVTSIGTSAFYNCTGLTSVTLNEGLTTIGTSAFYKCTSLKELTVPASVTTINKDAFYNSLEKITFAAGTKVIPKNACYRATNLKTAIIPDGVTTIGERAFYNCTNLESANIPSGVTSIEKEAFYNCASLQVIVPDTLTTVGDNAFYGCAIGGDCGVNLNWTLDFSAKTLTISGNGDMSFSGNAPWSGFRNFIEFVAFAEGTTSICDNAFSDCTKLVGVVFPASITAVGINAFQGCTALERVELSENLKSIGDSAFAGCDAVNTFIFCSNPPAIGTDALPDSSYKGYYPKTASGWTSQILGQYPNVAWSEWDDTLPTRDVVLVLDVSGSMSGSRLNALKTAVNTFATNIGGRITNTRIALIAYADKATTLMPFSSDIVRLRSCVNSMTANGDTYYVKALDAADTLLGESSADVKSLVIFSDGAPSDSTSSIRTKSAAMRANYYIYTVGLSPTNSNKQLLIDIAGSEKNYFGADDISQLSALFVSISENLGEENRSTITMARNGKTIDLRKEDQEFEQGSAELADIIVEPYWSTNVPGTVRLTQSGKTIFESKDGRFTGIAPGQRFVPLESINVTLVDADGTIAAMIRTKLSIVVPTSNRFDVPTTKTSITVYQNRKNSSSQDDDYQLSEGVQVTYNGASYTTNSNGRVSIPSLDSGSVTFVKAGFITRTLTADQLNSSSKVYLQPESSGSPVISAVWADNTDVLTQTYSLGLLSEASITLSAEVDWGSSSAGSISLIQESRSADFTGTTLTAVLSDTFDASEPIYIVAKDANGNSTKKELKFEDGAASKVVSALNGAGFSFGDSLKFTLPDSIKPDFMAGTTINVDLASTLLPITVTTDNGKVYVAIGADLVSYSSTDKWAHSTKTGNTAHIIKRETKTFIDKFKDTGILKGPDTTSLKKLKNLKQTYKTAIKYPQGSFGFDAKFTVLGFVEGVYDSTGTITWLDGGVIVNPSISISKSFPFSIWIIPLYFDTAFSADILGQLNVIFNERAKNFTPNGQISGDVKLKGGLGVGLKHVLYAEGGLEGTLSPLLKIYLDEPNYFKLTASLSLYAKAGIAIFEGEYPFEPFYDKVWIEHPSGRSFSANEALAANAELYNTERFTLKDLSYLDLGSTFNPVEATVFSERSGGLQTASTIKTNIYRQAAPQFVAFDDGTKLAVWIDSSSSDINALSLNYSYFDGSTWSSPSAVYNDGTLDYTPQLKKIGNTAYLVWQNATQQFTASNATLDSIAPFFDTAAAVFIPGTGFTVSELGYAGLDMIPCIGGTGDAVYAVWVNNSNNNWFGEGKANSILYSQYQNGTWSDASVLYSGLNSIGGLSACYNNGLQVAYSMDCDGNINTVEDSYIYVNNRRLTSGTAMETSPEYCGSALYWYSDGRVLHQGGSETDMIITSDRYQLVEGNGELVLLYTEPNGLHSTLKAAYYDQNEDAWSATVPLTDDDAFISSFSGDSTPDGGLSVLFSSQEVVGDYSSDNPYGSTDLQVINIPSNCDLSLGEVHYDANTYCPGKPIKLYFDLTNNGTKTINAVRVEVLDSNGQVLSSILLDDSLVPGETHETSTYFDVASDVTGQTVTVKASLESMAESNTTNNIRTVELKYEDICVENLSCGNQNNGHIVIMADIVNRGYHAQSNLTVSLMRDSLDGTIVETKTISTLEPLDVYPVAFEKDLASDTIYYVSVSGGSDSNAANNSDFITMISQSPPFVSILNVSSNCANLRLSNDLPATCYVAIYDTKDKMLTMGSAAVSTNAGEVAITYNNIVLPAVYKIKVFMLNDKMVPLYKAYSQTITQ